MREAAKIMAARWLCERAKLIELRYLENWQVGTKASGSKGVKGALRPTPRRHFWSAAGALKRFFYPPPRPRPQPAPGH